jgi:hypothetical protein
MVSKASDDLPEPLGPVMTTSLSRGIEQATFLRLCWRAPRTVMRSMRPMAIARRAARGPWRTPEVAGSQVAMTRERTAIALVLAGSAVAAVALVSLGPPRPAPRAARRRPVGARGARRRRERPAEAHGRRCAPHARVVERRGAAPRRATHLGLPRGHGGRAWRVVPVRGAPLRRARSARRLPQVRRRGALRWSPHRAALLRRSPSSTPTCRARCR